MLAAEAISAGYGRRRVLAGASLAVGPGSLVAVIGPNGAGKSTLLGALAGDLPPDFGRVTLDGRPLAAFGPEALARRRAVLPQATRLSFPFTVHEVLRLGVEAAGQRAAPAERSARIEAALATLDLAGFGPRLIAELSGGEQQRVHFARLLCQLPRPDGPEGAAYLLLDEPVASLDLRHQLATLGVARRFADAGGGVLAVLHDINLAAMFADRITVVAGGSVVADGAPPEVLTDTLIGQVFGLTLKVGATPPPPMPFVLPQVAAIGR